MTVFNDSKLCVDGVNKWMVKWKVDGWTRGGHRLKNADLWQLLSRVLDEYEVKGIDVHFKHVPTHVGIHDNERADKLVKAAVK